MKYFAPILFGMISFLFYILIYQPPLKTESEDFITAIMVFCAALAWNAVITLTKEKNQWIFYFYNVIIIILSLYMLIFFKGFNVPWHLVVLGLTLLSVVGLRLFITGYLKYKRRKQRFS